MTDTVEPGVLDVAGIARQEEWAEALSSLRARSSYSFKALAREIDRPTTTVHGWFSGRHLPYQRDNADVAQLLGVLGVDDPGPWMEALARCRETPVAESIENPYPGLRPFTEDDGRRFFGRDELVERLVATVRSGQTGAPTVVIGSSGSGKTSALRAGLVARLRADGAHVLAVTPSEFPRASAGDFDESPPQVLVVDQFEEALRGPDADVTVTGLRWFAERGGQVVIGLRSDFFHAAAEHPWLFEGLLDRQVLVAPPSIGSIASIVEGPAASVGVDVDARLTERLASDFGDTDGSTAALPMLSFLMQRLFAGRSGGTVMLEDYEREGGLAQVLERAAERAFADVPDGAKADAELLFKQMVALDGAAVPTRRSVGLAEFETLLDDDRDVDAVLGPFTAERLLVVDRDEVRLAHESMLTAWTRLGEWIDEERSTLAASRRVRRARDAWLESGEDDDALLRGRALAEAEELAGDPRRALRIGSDGIRFVEASRAVRVREQVRLRRRNRILATSAGVAAVAALSAGVLAVRADRASDRASSAESDALSRQLALQASILRSSDPTLSGQLALVAHDASPTLEARSALTDASALMPSARFLGASGPTALAIADDGSRLAYSNSVDGSIVVMRAADGGFEREMELPLADPETDVYALALSPDGSRLVSGGTDLFASLWDLGDATPTPMVLDDSKTLFEQPVQSLAFDRTGRFVYGSGTSTGIGVWDADGSPSTESELLPRGGSTMALDVDTERQLIAAGNLDGTVTLTDLGDPEAPIWEMPSEAGTAANTVDLSPDGSLLAVGYRDGLMRVWDVTDPTAPAEVSPDMEPFGTWINSVRFSPDGATVAAGSDGEIRVWEAGSWRLLGSIDQPNLVTNIRYLDEQSGFAALADGSVRSFRLDDLGVQSLGASIWSTSFTTDGERLLASSRERTTIWSIDDQRPAEIVAQVPPPDPEVGYSGTNAVSPDGRWAAFGSRTGPVWLYDMADLGGEPIPVTGLAALVDELNDTEGSSLLVENVAFSYDSTVLGAMGGDGYVQLWEVAGGEPVRAAGWQVPGFSRNIVFHPSEPLVAVASDTGIVHLSDISDPGAPVDVMELVSGPDQAYGIAFHPTEDVIATGNFDATMTIWDISDHDEPALLSTVTGPGSRLYDVAFDPSGELLSAAVGDGSLWMWSSADLEDVTLERRLDLPDGSVYTTVFSPDGSAVVAAGADQRVFWWALDPDAARDRVCASVGDSITDDEWSDLVPNLDYDAPC